MKIIKATENTKDKNSKKKISTKKTGYSTSCQSLKIIEHCKLKSPFRDFE
jgi:hypothetical protein